LGRKAYRTAEWGLQLYRHVAVTIQQSDSLWRESLAHFFCYLIPIHIYTVLQFASNQWYQNPHKFIIIDLRCFALFTLWSLIALWPFFRLRSQTLSDPDFKLLDLGL